MRLHAEGGNAIDVRVYDDGRAIRVALVDRGGKDEAATGIDENHAQALVLALQAAIAEVQARAVSL